MKPERLKSPGDIMLKQFSCFFSAATKTRKKVSVQEQECVLTDMIYNDIEDLEEKIITLR